MPPDERAVEVARLWLARAKSNLARARMPKPPESVWEDLCFDAQQAAEKATKAVLIFRRVDPPRTHDLEELLLIVRSTGLAVPADIVDVDTLSTYATAGRYPGAVEPVTEADYRAAVRLAELVVTWAESVIRG